LHNPIHEKNLKMIEKVEFDPPNILAGRDNHLRRLAHQRHIQSVAPPFALGAIIT
jgi:hypothetical protein